jgi:hypothetical protein
VRWGVGFQEGRSSFLKKRSKKLLSVWYISGLAWPVWAVGKILCAAAAAIRGSSAAVLMYISVSRMVQAHAFDVCLCHGLTCRAARLSLIMKNSSKKRRVRFFFLQA